MESTPRIDVSTITQAAGVGTVVFYVMGFVVTNAHLARWNAATFDLLNAQYLAAGLLFAVFIAIFSFIVGRRLYYLGSDIDSFAALGAPLRWPRAWSLFCHINVLTELFFGFVAGAFWTASLLFERTRDHNLFAGFLLAYFVIDYFVLFKNGVYSHRPFVALPLSFLAHVSIIVVALFWFGDASIASVVLIYFGLVVVLGMVGDISVTMKTPQLFTYFWIATFAVGTATTFGAYSYQYVRAGLGGGAPRPVEVYFPQDFPVPLLKSLAACTAGPVRLVQVAETSSYIIFATSESSRDVVRVSKQQIIAVRSFEKPSEWEANKPVGPTPNGAADR